MSTFDEYWLDFKESSLRNFTADDLATTKDMFYAGATAFVILADEATEEGEITRARKELIDYLKARTVAQQN